MIPELLKSVVGSVVRFLFTGIGAYLVNKGVVSADNVEALIAGAGMGLAALAWSLWEKYKSRLNFLTALASEPTTPESEVKAKAKLGGASGLVLALVLLPACLATSACNDTVRKIAENTKRIATLIDSARQVKNSLEESRLIGVDEGKKITQGLLKVNSALDAFNKRARAYASADSISTEGKAELRNLANDIAVALTELVNDGTFGVKNPESQTKINVAIAAVREVVITLADTIDQIKAKPGV